MKNVYVAILGALLITSTVWASDGGNGSSGNGTAGSSVAILPPNAVAGLAPKVLDDISQINFKCKIPLLIQAVQQKFPSCTIPSMTAIERSGFIDCPHEDYTIYPPDRDGWLLMTARRFHSLLFGVDKHTLPSIQVEKEFYDKGFDRLGQSLGTGIRYMNAHLVDAENVSTHTIFNERNTECQDPHGYENGNCQIIVNTEEMLQCLQQGLSNLGVQ